MTAQRAIEILQTERACASRTDCDRGCCRECDLVLDSTKELIETYDFVIEKLKEMESENKEDELNGFKKALELLEDFYDFYESRDDLSEDFLAGFKQATSILYDNIKLSDYFELF